jgi:hypothetical protein
VEARRRRAPVAARAGGRALTLREGLPESRPSRVGLGGELLIAIFSYTSALL